MARPRKQPLRRSMVTLQSQARARALSNLASKSYVKQVVNQNVNIAPVIANLAGTLSYDTPHIVPLTGSNLNNKHLLKSGLSYRFHVLSNHVGTSVFRVIMFQYLQSNKTAPTMEEILNASDGTLATEVYQNYDYDNRKNYKILFDRLQTVGGTTGGDIPNDRVYSGVIPLRSIQRKTIVPVGDGDALRGTIYLAAISDKPIASSSITMLGYVQHNETLSDP